MGKARNKTQDTNVHDQTRITLNVFFTLSYQYKTCSEEMANDQEKMYKPIYLESEVRVPNRKVPKSQHSHMLGWSLFRSAKLYLLHKNNLEIPELLNRYLK